MFQALVTPNAFILRTSFTTAISPASNLIAVHDGRSGASYYKMDPLGSAPFLPIAASPGRFPAPLSFTLDGAWCVVADNSTGVHFTLGHPFPITKV